VQYPCKYCKYCNSSNRKRDSAADGRIQNHRSMLCYFCGR